MNYRIVVDIGFPVVNLTPRAKFQDMQIEVGNNVFITINEGNIHIFGKLPAGNYDQNYNNYWGIL